MISPNDAPQPASEVTPGKRRVRAGLVALLLIVAAILEIPAYRLWNRAQRQGQEIARLSQQVEQLRGEVAQARAQTEAVLARATQAEQSAQQATQQRDQAVAARAQSEQLAAQARQQAALATEQATQAQQEAAILRAERQAELDRLQSALSEIASTHKTALGLVVTLGSDSIRFDFDKSTLRQTNREVLSRIAGVLMTLKGYHIYVYGYTDDIGTALYNQKLSERRAEAVRDYLVNAGLDPGIISTKGYGEADPLVKGASARARAKNRRVEIGIVDSVLQMQGLATPSRPDPHAP